MIEEPLDSSVLAMAAKGLLVIVCVVAVDLALTLLSFVICGTGTCLFDW